MSWIVHSGTTGKEEVFSFRRSDGHLMPMTGRTVRDELKKTCEHNGLPRAYFSSHSLRKGAITHMRAQGASEDNRRDRGNYSAGSQVMASVTWYPCLLNILIILSHSSRFSSGPNQRKSSLCSMMIIVFFCLGRFEEELEVPWGVLVSSFFNALAELY